jgi:hypothetical protein|tara:strand:+ start:800 stop:1153 length:354 start_codon:yes stop_codon:yes gene_type:complete
MFEKFMKMFKAKQKEESKSENKEKAKATKNKQPWIQVLTTHVDKTNPKNGFFELDWNEYFVQSLKLNGYRGATDEEVVDKWFQDLCRNVASESGTEDVGASGYVNKVLRDDGKTEVS